MARYFTVCISCTELLSRRTTLVSWRKSLVFSTLAPMTTSSWCWVSAVAVEPLPLPQAQDQLSSNTFKSQQFLSSVKAPLISLCWLQGRISRVGLLPCFEKGSEKQMVYGHVRFIFIFCDIELDHISFRMQCCHRG